MLSINIFGLYTWLFLITVLVALYFYLSRNNNYWASRGVNGPKVTVVTVVEGIYRLLVKSLQELIDEDYTKYGKIYGSFLGNRPVLVVAEPELIKDMLIKNFHIFVDRIDIKTGDPLNDRSLVSLNGEEWKKMRSIISPTFSSGKMRSMHPIIIDCVKRLEDYLQKKIENNSNVTEVELKKVMSSLTMDVIASCAFGTKIDTYNDEKKSEFITYAEKALKPSLRTLIALILLAAAPKLAKWLGIKLTDQSSAQFFKSAVRQSILLQCLTTKQLHS